jgi:hypothetical protein
LFAAIDAIRIAPQRRDRESIGQTNIEPSIRKFQKFPCAPCAARGAAAGRQQAGRRPVKEACHDGVQAARRRRKRITAGLADAVRHQCQVAGLRPYEFADQAALGGAICGSPLPKAASVDRRQNQFPS